MESDDMKSVIPLPDELLTDIISRFIPLSQWSGGLEYVSRQFQRCVLIAYGGITSMKCIKLFSLTKFKSYGNSREAEADYSIQFNSILEKLLTVCPNLADIVSVHFTTSRAHSFPVCWDLLAQFDRLQSISLMHIEGVEFRSFAYFVANSKSLKILNITCCGFDSGGILNVGSLSVVSFRYGMIVMRPPIMCLENLSEKLTDLTVQSLETAFKADHDALKHCSNLERLSVSLFKENDYKIFISNLPSLCKLTSLQIKGCFHYSYNPLNPIVFSETFCGHLNFLKNQLRCIEFSGIFLSEEVQHFLLTECLQLHSLIFGRLSADAVKNLRRLPANLQKLTFGDHNAETLPILLPNLVQLTNLTDLTIIDFSCRDWKKWENICCLVNLENLRLYNMYNVNDALLQAWDRKSPEMFEKLVTLEMRYCSQISDIGGILIASKAQNLKRLVLFSSRITEKTILILADFAKKLVETELEQTEIDENAVISLIKKAKRLKKIKVSGQLAEKLIANENFLPLAENVEIEIGY